MTNVLHDVDLSELHGLARTYGTPFFLYDADAVNRRIRQVREACVDLVRVYYAVKANPNLELLRAVRSTADGLDISSVGELEQGLLAGYDAEHMSFAGPAKTTAELTRAIQCGIGCISIESIRELRECIKIAAQHGTRANIALRVNPRLLNRSFGLKMGGRAVQFGIDEEDLAGAADIVCSNSSSLLFQGIHVYAGSQCFEADGVADCVRDTFRIVRELESASRLRCNVVNLGGGFGVSHSNDARELDLAKLGEILLPALRSFHAESGRELIFELGRFLTADAGIYVSRVISDKTSRGKTFYVLDGGLHHHLAAAGTFGAALRSNFPLHNLTNPSAPPVRCSLAGPSCNPTDLLGVDVELPQPALGDLVAVLRSGSYGFTASPLLFLGRPTAVELVRTQGKVVLGRRARTMADFN
jgi:diaminopimelate decarboxylase